MNIMKVVKLRRERGKHENCGCVFFAEGNTKYTAEKIAKELDADTIRLIPVKEFPTGKVSKFFWGHVNGADNG